MRGSAPAPRMWGSYPHAPAFALYSTYFLIHRHCLRPRIVRRVVRHDPRPVHPGGPANVASFRRAIGADKTAAATPAPFLVRFAQPKTQKFFRPQAAKIYSGCCGFSRPIRSSPKFGKANSIVWMIPNERVGAWMPLGRVCSIGFGKRGLAGTRAREDCKETPLLTLGRRAGFCSCKTGISAIHGGRRSPAIGRQRRPVQRLQAASAATQWQPTSPAGLAKRIGKPAPSPLN